MNTSEIYKELKNSPAWEHVRKYVETLLNEVDTISDIKAEDATIEVRARQITKDRLTLLLSMLLNAEFDTTKEQKTKNRVGIE